MRFQSQDGVSYVQRFYTGSHPQELERVRLLPQFPLPPGDLSPRLEDGPDLRELSPG